jgi:hypothetical protein
MQCPLVAAVFTEVIFTLDLSAFFGCPMIMLRRCGARTLNKHDPIPAFNGKHLR